MDPVQAVNDATDELSSLLNKFQGSGEFILAQFLFV